MVQLLLLSGPPLILMGSSCQPCEVGRDAFVTPYKCRNGDPVRDLAKPQRLEVRLSIEFFSLHDTTFKEQVPTVLQLEMKMAS